MFVMYIHIIMGYNEPSQKKRMHILQKMMSAIYVLSDTKINNENHSIHKLKYISIHTLLCDSLIKEDFHLCRT